MKAYMIVILSLLVAIAVCTPIILAGCISNKYNIVKYPTVKNYFQHAVIDNLKLSAQNINLLANQDRGFRGEVYYTLGTEKAYPGNNQNYIDCVNEQLELYSEDNINILQCYIYLTEYKNRDLDETAINQLKSYFEFLKSKNIRILLRFAYEYTSNENNAAKDKQILSHLDQIGEFVNNNKQLFNDVVYAMQFGLIGLWGEGHGDHYTNHNFKKLMTKLCEVIPEEIFIMVRTPEFLSQVPKQYEKRFSVHDDFLVGMDHKWGMMSWNDPQYKVLQNRNKYTIADGEMPWGRDTTVPVIDSLNLVKQVADYGLTTLSVTHNYKEDFNDKNITYHLEKWKTEYLTQQQLERNTLPYLESMLVDKKISVYNYLQYHLGYNLGVSNLILYPSKTSFMINNFGMAAPCEYQLQIIADGKEIEVETKLLTAFGQQVVTIPQKVNEIKIKYTHKRSGATIRFANDLPYENGYNIINIESIVNKKA